MDKSIAQYIQLLSKNIPLEEGKYFDIIKFINCDIPRDYLQFMKEKNGGEGIIGEGAYVRFWPLEELVDANHDYNVSEFAPELFMIGTDGGGNGFGFRKKNGIFVEVSFVELSNEDAIERGRTFVEFLSYLSKQF